ncbi:hypothetical protein RchiOBHm_Chr1g0347111 [Rosa chinensis]|uniref:DUF4283 domain-containing protein n=1 Tax=Rosa chinensis TaxID=74649 RepID=A0A2P6SF72_ROSCH|nr:hypothetical protein RchiOBHm_Chr1g0347111 [Rosa chinensis]
MEEDMASTLVAALALTEDAVVDFGEVGSAEVTEEFFYLVGRLVQRKVGDEKGLPSTLSAIWGLGDHSAILVVGEGRFLFHFQCCDECNKILLGEPWFFNRHMLVLGESDPIRLITANYGLGDLGCFNANLCRRLLFSVDPVQSIDLRALNDAACRVSSTKLDLPISFGALKIVGSCNVFTEKFVFGYFLEP